MENNIPDVNITPWLISLFLATLVLFGFYVIRRAITTKSIKIRRIAKQAHLTILIDWLQQTKSWFVLTMALYIASFPLDLPEKADYFLSKLALIAFLIQMGLWIHHLISHLTENLYREQGKLEKTTWNLIRTAAQITLWVFALLFLLDNLNFDIATLLAGLGIGGIAMALAMQNILGDLFASLSIMIDKPFVIGDIIEVGNFIGTVESIGLKTIRVRSIHGEQIVFSNTDLLKSRLRNHKKMQKRRVSFPIKVSPSTPHETLTSLPGMIKDVIQSIEGTQFERAHLTQCEKSSLDFEIVYTVFNPNYSQYMDIQQEIHFGLIKKFKEENIEWA